jgi:hypothetical protein
MIGESVLIMNIRLPSSSPDAIRIKSAGIIGHGAVH